MEGGDREESSKFQPCKHVSPFEITNARIFYTPGALLVSFSKQPLNEMSENTKEMPVTKHSLPEAPKEGAMRNKQ